jgi:hypothetical protein
MRRQVAAAHILGLASVVTSAPLLAQTQRFAFDEARVEIFNAVGRVNLRAGGGREVVVVATLMGPDSRRIELARDSEREWGVFRVVYPVGDFDRIAAPEGAEDQNTNLRLRSDGTFGGDAGEGPWWRRRSRRGEEVEIGGRAGRGAFRGWADLEITVPAGRELKLHLAVGTVTIQGVRADAFIDTWSAPARATDIGGSWLFDAGSGDVQVTGMEGTLRIDTGSGNATVRDVTGELLDVDTGSGDVDVDGATVQRFRFDTGSGDVRAMRLGARRGLADTGSGSVELELAGSSVDDLLVDTGSGDVILVLPAEVDARLSIDTGSGGARIERSGAIFERQDDGELVLRFGEGRGRIRVDTGSGEVRIR